MPRKTAEPPKPSVVDASVALKWGLQEGLSDAVERLLDVPLQAPDIWLLECGNVLWVYARRRQIGVADAVICMTELRQAPVELVPTARVAELAFKLAFDLGERIYDCAYLALAIETGSMLVTADNRFTQKVQSQPLHARRVLTLLQIMSDGSPR